MDILQKLDRIQERLDEEHSEDTFSEPIIVGVYPGGYESMDNNLLTYYYESARANYEETKKALEEIEKEIKRRGPLG